MVLEVYTSRKYRRRSSLFGLCQIHLKALTYLSLFVADVMVNSRFHFDRWRGDCWQHAVLRHWI